jgi:hypothetical protein
VRSWLAILVTLAACNDPDVERLTAIKANVCACKTASCAEQEMKLVPQSAIKSPHRMQEIARDLLECLARLQAAERPAADPDAEDTAEPPGTPSPGAEPPAAPPPGTLPPGTPPPSTLPPPSAPRTAAPASARTR